MIRFRLIAWCVGALTLLSACGGVKAPAGIDSSAKLAPAPKMSDTLLYVNQAVDARKFTKFILEPVGIYKGEDNDFGSIEPEERQMMADFVRDQFVKAFAGSHFPIVTTPGPDVLKVRFTLAGLTRSVPAAQGANYLLFPVGTGVQVMKGALGSSGTFMGNAIIAVEFIDSGNNETVAALVTKLSANALNFKAAFSGKYGSAQSGIVDFMELLRRKADENHGFSARTR